MIPVTSGSAGAIASGAQQKGSVSFKRAAMKRHHELFRKELAADAPAETNEAPAQAVNDPTQPSLAVNEPDNEKTQTNEPPLASVIRDAIASVSNSAVSPVPVPIANTDALLVETDPGQKTALEKVLEEPDTVMSGADLMRLPKDLKTLKVFSPAECIIARKKEIQRKFGNLGGEAAQRIADLHEQLECTPSMNYEFCGDSVCAKRLHRLFMVKRTRRNASDDEPDASHRLTENEKLGQHCHAR
jgi:hypothetical protein